MKRKPIDLDDYEKELVETLESEQTDLPPPTKGEMAKYREMARRTLTKDKRINIRISSRDLLALKRKAHRYGMPYQTLISSVLHRYVSGELQREPE